MKNSFLLRHAEPLAPPVVSASPIYLTGDVEIPNLFRHDAQPSEVILK